MSKISIVTTLYYSEPYVEEFYKRAKETVCNITDNYEFIFVNDGSPDQSIKSVLQLQTKDSQVVAVDLSRNFGHHKALMTGLRFATGDYIFLIDSDLEESPELLATYWEEIRKDQTIDVVYGVQPKRKGNWFEKTSGKWFYRFFSLLSNLDYPHDSLTARLMKKDYVQSIVSFPEREFDLWGLFVLAGYNQKEVIAPKSSKGISTYNIYRKLRMSIDMITSISSRPLYLIFVIGLIVSFLSFLNVCYIILQKYYYNIEDGWASTIASIWLVGGIIILLLGIIGIYLSKMFSEIKQRPYGIVKKLYVSRDYDRVALLNNGDKITTRKEVF